MPGTEEELSTQGFSFSLRRERRRLVRRREGLCLLRSNMVAEDLAELWHPYIQLSGTAKVQGAEARPRGPSRLPPGRGTDRGAHLRLVHHPLMIQKNVARPRAGGLNPHAIIESLGKIQIVDGHPPITDGRSVVPTLGGRLQKNQRVADLMTRELRKSG